MIQCGWSRGGCIYKIEIPIYRFFRYFFFGTRYLEYRLRYRYYFEIPRYSVSVTDPGLLWSNHFQDIITCRAYLATWPRITLNCPSVRLWVKCEKPLSINFTAGLILRSLKQLVLRYTVTWRGMRMGWRRDVMWKDSLHTIYIYIYTSLHFAGQMMRLTSFPFWHCTFLHKPILRQRQNVTSKEQDACEK